MGPLDHLWPEETASSQPIRSKIDRRKSVHTILLLHNFLAEKQHILFNKEQNHYDIIKMISGVLYVQRL